MVDLLVAMGYGGGRESAGQSPGASPGTAGVDGIIQEDRLGLDALYVQAKRWENTVGRPVVQAFLRQPGTDSKSKKGVLITTSQFSKEAADYVSVIGEEDRARGQPEAR